MFMLMATLMWPSWCVCLRTPTRNNEGNNLYCLPPAGPLSSAFKARRLGCLWAPPFGLPPLFGLPLPPPPPPYSPGQVNWGSLAREWKAQAGARDAQTGSLERRSSGRWRGHLLALGVSACPLNWRHTKADLECYSPSRKLSPWHWM